MDNLIIIPIALFIGAVIQSYISIKTLTNDAYFSNHVMKSLKARMWKKLIGEERTIWLVKKVAAPLGLIFAVVYVIVGIVLLSKRISVFS